MDYKEKYKAAIERAKEELGSGCFNKGSIEYIFPELKESAGEKIRKALIDYFEGWQTRAIDENAAYYKDIAIKDILAWLEKQGEQKPFDYENANIQQKDFAPKVEPKFKVGDWVAINNSEIGLRSPLYIIDSDETQYRVKDVNGNSGCPKIGYLDNHYHLWSIQDAKDGDVLVADGQHPFIYNGRFDERSIGAHGGVNVAGDFTAAISGTRCWTILTKDIRLATEEECKYMYGKMRQAGYYWDGIDRELKKEDKG